MAALCEECKQLEAFMRRSPNRKHLSVHDEAQHLETRVPISKLANGLEGLVRHTTFAQQAKMVGRQRLNRSQASATIRSPLHLD